MKGERLETTYCQLKSKTLSSIDDEMQSLRDWRRPVAGMMLSRYRCVLCVDHLGN